MVTFAVRLYGSRLISMTKNLFCIFLVPLSLPFVSAVDLSDEVLEDFSSDLCFGFLRSAARPKVFPPQLTGSRFVAPSRWFGAVPIFQSGAKAPSLGFARFSSAGLILQLCVLGPGPE
jgi:hypothetical protein